MMKTFPAFYMGCLTASICLLCLGTATAQSNTASAVPSVRQLQLQSRFRQTKIADCTELAQGKTLDGRSFNYTDGDLTIDGTDTLGRRYSITKGSGAAGCSIWSANLDGTTGPPDLEIVTPGEDSSGGYDTTLSILLFDQDGRPFPWQVIGNFTTTENAGVDQMIATTTSANASVIVPTKEGLAGPDASLIFELYRFAPSQVIKVTGSEHGLAWPIVSNQTPALIAHRQRAALSINLNQPATESAIVASTSPVITGASSLQLADGSTILPPATLVLDSSTGSRIIHLDPTIEEIAQLIQKKSPVRTIGVTCEEEECRPMVLVATTP